MKWLIYGGNGWIGNKFIKLLEELEETVIIANARADNDIDVQDEIETLKPDRVICCIGRTHGPECNTIDYIEDKLMINIRDNLYGPFILASVCNRKDIHMTYIGTGCIFTYEDDKRLFTEEDLPNYFGSGYSIVKGFTDRMMKHFKNVLNARIRMPIDNKDNKRNFITKIAGYKNICSIQNSMTVLSDILPILIDMAKRDIRGTYNMTNPGTIEHNEVLEMYRTYVEPNKEWNNFSVAEQRSVLKSDRSNNELDVTKLKTLYPELKNIKESVEHVMRTYN